MAEIDDLISKDALNNLEKLYEVLSKIVPLYDAIIQKAAAVDASTQKMNAGNKTTADTQKEVNQATKDATKINKELKLAEDEEVKTKIKYANAVKEQRERLQAQIKAEKAAADSIVVMKQKLAELNKEYQIASSAVRDKLAPQMKQLTDNIRAAEKATGDHRRGVGSYAEGIKEAGKMLFNFAGIVGVAEGVLHKLKEAFADTEQGVKFFKQVGEASSTFFQNLISGNTQLAGVNALAAAEIAKGLDALRIKERADQKAIATAETEVQLLRLKASTEKDATKQLELYRQADEQENEAIRLKSENIQEELDLLYQLQATRPDDAKLAEEINQREIQLIQIKGDKNIRIQAKIAAGEEKLREATEKAEQKRAEEAKKSADLRALYEQNVIEANKSANEQIILTDTELYDWQKVNADAAAEAMQESIDATVEAEREAAEKKKQYDQEAFNLKAELANSAFNLVSGIYDNQMAKLEANQKKELALAGDDAEKKAAIEAKYQKKKNDLAKKQAKAEKAQGIFNIAISTAEAIMKAYAQFGPIAGTILVPLILAIAALQTATILAKPLPQYAKGTNYSSGGAAIVGEKGSELVVDPSGHSWLTGDSPEIVNLKRGSKIIPSEETKRIMSAAGSMRRSDMEATQERRHKELIKTIKEKDSVILNVGTGNSIEKRSGNTYKKYFDRHLQ